MYMKKINLSASHLNGIFADHEVGRLISEFVDRYPGKWFSAQQLYQKHTGEPVSFSDTADRINLTYNTLIDIPDEALKSGWIKDVIAYLKYSASDDCIVARKLLERINPDVKNITCPRCGGRGAIGVHGNCTLCGGKGWVDNDGE